MAAIASIGAAENFPNEPPNKFIDGHLDEFRIGKSNIFNASPNSGNTDTISIPTSAATP